MQPLTTLGIISQSLWLPEHGVPNMYLGEETRSGGTLVIQESNCGKKEVAGLHVLDNTHAPLAFTRSQMSEAEVDNPGSHAKANQGNGSLSLSASQ